MMQSEIVSIVAGCGCIIFSLALSFQHAIGAKRSHCWPTAPTISQVVIWLTSAAMIYRGMNILTHLNTPLGSVTYDGAWAGASLGAYAALNAVTAWRARQSPRNIQAMKRLSELAVGGVVDPYEVVDRGIKATLRSNFYWFRNGKPLCPPEDDDVLR